MEFDSAALPGTEDRALEHCNMSDHDELTGLHGRQFFFDILEWELRRILRSRNDVSLCLIDIDNFRDINERYGRSAGDEVLCQIADIIAICCRDTDLPARLGGEEFGVFLPDTAVDGADEVAERIRKAVAKHEFKISDKLSIHCTVSIGIAGADYEDAMNTSTTLYRIAETRLYIAKHSGRDQVAKDAILNLH